MATTEELLNPDNLFLFRGKKYKLRSMCPDPSIDLISEDGEIFGFGIDSPIQDEFILIEEP